MTTRTCVGLALLSLLSTGCASQMGFGRATTLEPGQSQIASFAQVDLVTPKSGERGEPVGLPWAQIGFGYHRGVADRVEIGARGWIFGLPAHLAFGAAGDVKVQLVRSEPGHGLQIATGVSLGYHQVQLGGQPWHSFTGWVPLLFAHDFGRHQFVVGPRAGYTVWAGEGQNPVKLPWFGGSTGVSFAPGKSRIMPEVVIVYCPVSFNGAIENDRYGAYVVQLGLMGAYEP